MNTIKLIILLFIASLTFLGANAQEFGDNACENYNILVKSADNNFKSIIENTDGHWADGQKDRYLTSKDFKIAGIEGYLVIEPGNKHIYIINKKESNRENKQEKMKAYISMLEKCYNVKSAIVTEDGIKKTQYKIINAVKKYAITIDVMGKDDDDVILTHLVKTDI
jgi:hypothetical protein